jgi:AcrR family transcriptional regulator
MDSTRERFLAVAAEQFAERGFYGVSIAQVADQLGLTKQALLHHFGSKEKLYGEVLQVISAELEQLLTLAEGHTGGEQQLMAILSALVESGQSSVVRNRLLMRELLDNSPRAPLVRRWYLKPFLNGVADILRQSERWSSADQAEVLAAAYQLLGAVTYFAVSGPTLAGIFGPELAAEMAREFTPQLKARVDEVMGV